MRPFDTKKGTLAIPRLLLGLVQYLGRTSGCFRLFLNGVSFRGLKGTSKLGVPAVRG